MKRRVAIALALIATASLVAVLWRSMHAAPRSAELAVASPDAADAERVSLTALGATDGITEVDVERQPWQFSVYDGQALLTPHYVVYTTLTRNALLDRLPLFLERGLAHYTSALGPLPMPRDRLETYLFDTRNQWEAKTRQMLPDQAGTFLTLGRGGFTTRGTSVLYYIGSRDTLAIASHEGWHQYSQRVLNNQLPLWLEEGMATYMEGYVSYPDGLPRFRPWANVERYHTLRRAVRADRLIPLSELIRRTPQSFLGDGKARLLVYYAQVWALTRFLAEGDQGQHRAALRQLLADAAAGRVIARIRGSSAVRSDRRRGVRSQIRNGPAVLMAYFGGDLESLAESYHAFVLDLASTPKPVPSDDSGEPATSIRSP